MKVDLLTVYGPSAYASAQTPQSAVKHRSGGIFLRWNPFYVVEPRHRKATEQLDHSNDDIAGRNFWTVLSSILYKIY